MSTGSESMPKARLTTLFLVLPSGDRRIITIRPNDTAACWPLLQPLLVAARWKILVSVRKKSLAVSTKPGDNRPKIAKEGIYMVKLVFMGWLILDIGFVLGCVFASAITRSKWERRVLELQGELPAR